MAITHQPFRTTVATIDDVRRALQDLDLKISAVSVAHSDLTGVTADQHHARSHALDGTSDHTIGSLTNTYLIQSNGTKLVPATNTDAQVAAAVTASHARSHALDSGSDHTGSLTVALGGTGKTSATANSYLKGNGTSALTERTYSEVKTDLGLNTTDTPQFSRVGLGVAADATTRLMAGVSSESTPVVSARGGGAYGNAVEWGYATSGYGANLCHEVGSGEVGIALCAEAGTTSNKYTARNGRTGSVIKGSGGGALMFGRVPTGANQDFTEDARLDATGLGIGMTAAYKLDVSGQARLVGGDGLYDYDPGVTAVNIDTGLRFTYGGYTWALEFSSALYKAVAVGDTFGVVTTYLRRVS